MALNKPPRPRRDLVSAGSLGLIQRRIRLPKEPSELGWGQCFRSHANADGELGCGMLVNKGTRFAGLAKTLCDHCSLVEVNAGQKDHKLVSAMSPDYRGSASDRLFDYLGKVYESAISSLVPISIVEATKGIDVAQERRDQLSPAPCFLKSLGCDSVKPRSVQQARQSVDPR